GVQLSRVDLGVVPVDLGVAAARRADGGGAGVLPDPRGHRAAAVLPLAVHPPGACVQRADWLPVPAVHRLSKPRRRRQTRAGGLASAAPRVVTLPVAASPAVEIPK